MRVELIKLWNHDDHARLHAYVPDQSATTEAERKLPAVIVCPGGAYLFASEREGEPVALRFASRGYRAFVLHYTTRFRNRDEFDIAMSNPPETPEDDEEPVWPRALYDLAKAMLILRENAERWRVDPDKIAVCGFSAGGHLAASLGVHWHGDPLKETFKQAGAMFKPNALILGYAPTDFTIPDGGGTSGDSYSRLRELAHRAMFGTAEPSREQLERLNPANVVTSDASPAFIWHTADDRIVDVGHAFAFSSALARHGVPFELHVFESGEHGLSLCDETTAAHEGQIRPECGVWVDLALVWLSRQLGLGALA